MRVGYHPELNAPLDPDCARPGRFECRETEVMRVLRFLCVVINEPIEFVELSASAPFGYVNETTGVWQGWLGAVHSGAVDTLADGVSRTITREHYFAITYPFSNLPPAVIVPVLEAQSDLDVALRFLKIFQPEVWLGILLLLFTFVGTVKFSYRYMGQRNRLTIWHFLEHYLMQNTPVSDGSTTCSLSLILALGSLFCMFTLIVYQGYLLSVLVRPSVPEVDAIDINQLIQIIQQNDAKLAMQPGTAYDREIAESPVESMVGLREAIQHNPIDYEMPSNATELGRALLAGERVYFQYSLPATTLLRKLNSCQLHMIRATGFTTFLEGFAFSKENQALADRVDEAILEHLTFINRIIKSGYREWQQFEARCVSDELDRTTTVGEPLKLLPFLGAYMFLLFGLALAAAAVGLERCTHRRRLAATTTDDDTQLQPSPATVDPAED